MNVESLIAFGIVVVALCGVALWDSWNRKAEQNKYRRRERAAWRRKLAKIRANR